MELAVHVHHAQFRVGVAYCEQSLDFLRSNLRFSDESEFVSGAHRVVQVRGSFAIWYVKGTRKRYKERAGE